ncbi:hypothetical protein ABT090_20860 [Streptomyces asoensis]|uniref:hypothetical protein n=1 Tax=Streptomyces asoensis TaxID=249586 RepID=UPI0033341D73
MTDQTIPLTEQQLDEIEARANALNSLGLPGATWEASSHDEKSVTPPEMAHVVEDVLRTKHSLLRASVGVFGDERHAAFVAHAPEDVRALAAEVRRLRAGLEAAQRLAADATAYQVHVPEGGGTTLLVRRQASAHGTGWAVSTMAPGGGRAWTTEGWQESISALSVDRLFCWPAPAVAAAEARRALAAAAVSGAADSRPA